MINETTPHDRSPESDGRTIESRDGNHAALGGRPAGNRSLRSRRWGRFLPIVARSAVSVFIIAMGVAIFLAVGRGRSPREKKPRAAPRPVVEAVPLESHDGGIDFDVDGVVIAY